MIPHLLVKYTAPILVTWIIVFNIEVQPIKGQCEMY